MVVCVCCSPLLHFDAVFRHLKGLLQCKKRPFVIRWMSTLGCFDKFSYVTEPQWLGFKDFKNVMTKGDIEHTANGLVDEIKHLVDEINSFLI